jgi:hypothetical protein
MKVVTVLFCLMISLGVSAQDATTMLRLSEEKTYTPKQKGLTDLVVDIVNPQVTSQLNEQMIFGHLKEVSFRLYWTSSPERVAIEVMGLPEGFREIKEELKASTISRLESIISIPLEKKFQSYKFRTDPKKSKTVVATDPTGLQAIPEFEFIFDTENKLTKIIAKKPIGEQETNFEWQKTTWSEPRFHVVKSSTNSRNGAQTIETESSTSWQVISGIGLPSMVKTITSQKLNQKGQLRPVERKSEEVVYFKNYKVNQSEAMKWFLGNSGEN